MYWKGAKRERETTEEVTETEQKESEGEAVQCVMQCFAGWNRGHTGHEGQ